MLEGRGGERGGREGKGWERIGRGGEGRRKDEGRGSHLYLREELIIGMTYFC